MTFFSTAANSPKAGSLGKYLLGLDLQERQLDENIANRKDIQLNKALAVARQKKLSTSLLGLEDTSKESIAVWAKENEVTATELKNLSPILEMRKPVKSEKGYGPVTKDALGRQYQLSPKGKREYLPEQQTPENSYSAVKSDSDGRQYQISPKGKREYLPDSKGSGQYGKVQTDQYNREYQIAPSGKREYLPSVSTGQGDLNKVAPWYQTMLNETTRFYASGNLEPTAVQQSKIDRAVSRAEVLTSQIAQEYKIGEGEAYQIASAKLRKERIVSRTVQEDIPVANTGYNSNKTETVLLVKDMLRRQIPVHIIGETLIDKGWSNTETAQMLQIATTLIPAKEAGIDLKKLSKRVPKQGQSIAVAGKRWTREGDFLVSENGERVAIDGR